MVKRKLAGADDIGKAGTMNINRFDDEPSIEFIEPSATEQDEREPAATAEMDKEKPKRGRKPKPKSSTRKNHNFDAKEGHKKYPVEFPLECLAEIQEYRDKFNESGLAYTVADIIVAAYNELKPTLQKGLIEIKTGTIPVKDPVFKQYRQRLQDQEKRKKEKKQRQKT